MTEDEAKTKWCPFARSVDHEATINREVGKGGPQMDCFCLGSGCMAWRVRHPEIRREATDYSADLAMNKEALKTHRRVRREHGNWPSSGYDSLIIDADGYCGLAGML